MQNPVPSASSRGCDSYDAERLRWLWHGTETHMRVHIIQIRTSTHSHKCAHTRVHTHTHVYNLTHMCTHTSCTHLHMHTYVHTLTRAHTHPTHKQYILSHSARHPHHVCTAGENLVIIQTKLRIPTEAEGNLCPTAFVFVFVFNCLS